MSTLMHRDVGDVCNEVELHFFGVWPDGVRYAFVTLPPIPGEWPNGASALTAAVDLDQLEVWP